MKKTFKLEGLECSDCASKMEKEISKIDGINSISINFITAKMIIDGEDKKIDTIVNEAKKTIKKIEPDVAVKII
jgi:copper chaperone CopZ